MLKRDEVQKRISMRIIRRSIERVNDPFIFGIFSFSGSPLRREYHESEIRHKESEIISFFTLFIDLGDKIDFPLN